jgi:hypothetical protein
MAMSSDFEPPPPPAAQEHKINIVSARMPPFHSKTRRAGAKKEAADFSTASLVLAEG